MLKTAFARGGASSGVGVALAGLLLFSILFGGGGAEGPLNAGAIEAASAVMLLILAAGHFTGARPLAGFATVPILLLALLLLVLALQLVPLPPSIWHAFPGRELERSVLGLIGRQDSWRPLSLDPEATRRFAASLLTPAALLVGVLGCTRAEARRLIQTVVIAAVISGAVGALQLALDYPSWLIFYEGPNPGTASGIFANSNHHGSLLLVALVCLAIWIRTGTRPRSGRAQDRFQRWLIHPAWAAMPFLVILVLATHSRAATGLLLLAVPLAVAIALGLRTLALASVGLAALAAVGLMLIFLSGNASGFEAINRYAISDPRFSYLPDMLFGLAQYWPWGSGAGTFPTVFLTLENLDVMQPETLNHAHNDFLEWLVDFGAAGAIWLLLGVIAIGWRAFGRLRKRGSGWTAIGALGVLLLLGLHSAVDYPIRTDAISVIVGLAAGLVFAPLPEDRVATRRWSKAALIVALLAGMVIGVQTLRLRVAEAAVRRGAPANSVAVRPQNGDGLALAAEGQLLDKRPDAARALAARSIDRSPLSVGGVSVLAATKSITSKEATAAWQVASAMGWRDRATQLWAMHVAFANKEYATAAARADALLRIDTRVEYQKAVRAFASNPAFREALLQRLQLMPHWRAKFFSLSPDSSEQEVAGVLGTLEALGRTKELRRADAGPAIGWLVERKQYRPAYRIYAMVQPAPAGLGSLNPDPGFSRPSSEYRSNGTAFDWQVTPAPGVAAEVDPGTRALAIETNGRTALRAAHRYLLVNPGSYELAYRVRGDASVPSGIRVAIVCAGQSAVLGTSSTDDLAGSNFERRRFPFDVPSSCGAIAIEFTALADGSSVSAEFDDVTISSR